MLAGITNRTDRHTTLLYFCLIVMIGLSGAIVGPSLPSFERLTESSTESIAWLFTAKALGIVVGALVSGRLYDRVSGHTILAVAILLLSPLFAAMPFITDLPLLLIITLLGGICEGAVHVGANSLLVRLHTSKVAPYLNGLHFSFGVGATAAPAALGISFEYGGGIVWPYVGIAILMLVLVPILFKLPTPERQHWSQRSDSDAKTSSQRLFPAFLVLLFFLYVGAESGISGWIYSYALELELADNASAAWLTSLFWGGLTFGRLAGVSFSRRFASHSIMLVNLLGGIAALCWIGFAAVSFVSLAFGALLFGLVIASFFPTTMAFAGERISLTGSITGWFFVGAAAGSMTFPWLIGQFFTSAGPSSMLIVSGGALVLGLVLYSGIRRMRLKPTHD